MVKKEKLKKIILGTWPISGDFTKVKDKESLQMLKYANELGITEFDTAPNYGFGKSEYLIGKAFSKLKKKPKINTKIGNNHEKHKNFELKNLRKTFEKSLRLLKVNKINILYLHNPRNIENEKEIIDYLKFLKKKKKINNFGISISKDFKYNNKFINKFKIIQLDYNIIYLENAFNKQFKKKIIHARSPFATGTIFLKNSKKRFLKNDVRYQWATTKRKKVIISQLKLIKKTFKHNTYDITLNFLFNDNFVNKIIFGIKNKIQLLNLMESLKKINENLISIRDYKKFYLSNDIFKEKGF